jgi:hypothetical protein
MLYDHTVHMGHFGRSGTVLDTPNTLVSILNLTTIYCHFTHSVHRLPGSFIRDFFARALLILLLTHSPYMYYDHTAHMSYLGRSGTLLDPPNTQVSNPHATALYCKVQ